MTEQQKARQIAAFNKQIAALREQINKANTETKVHTEKRDKLDEQFKEYRNDIHTLENERNSLNEKVKTLKKQRDTAQARKGIIIEEIMTRSKKIAELKKKKPKKSRRQLEREIKDIEWKIQTTPLDLREEKRFVEKVKQLEPQLNIYKKIEQQNQKIAELRKELKTLEAEANAHHRELIETAQKSQEVHLTMVAKISEAKTIKGEADRLHKAYIQAKEQAKPLHQEMEELTEKRKKLQDVIREESEKQKKNAEKVLKEKLESQARDKLQRGEKLSWDEFQLLADHDSTNT